MITLQLVVPCESVRLALCHSAEVTHTHIAGRYMSVQLKYLIQNSAEFDDFLAGAGVGNLADQLKVLT